MNENFFVVAFEKFNVFLKRISFMPRNSKKKYNLRE
jgi:hypothetical protein